MKCTSLYRNEMDMNSETLAKANQLDQNITTTESIIKHLESGNQISLTQKRLAYVKDDLLEFFKQKLSQYEKELDKL